jgi:hypothetical protein
LRISFKKNSLWPGAEKPSIAERKVREIKEEKHYDIK